MSKTGLTVLATLLLAMLLVYKYASTVLAFARIANPESVSSAVKTASGQIRSCRVIDKAVQSSKGIELNRDIFKVLISLENHIQLFPISLADESDFTQVKGACEKNSYVIVEYTSINKKLERINAYHVNELMIPESGLVVNALMKF